MKDKKIYLELENNSTATHLKVSIYYSLGGMNYFSGNSEERGIYVSVSPVKRELKWESTTAFSGVKELVKPLKRFSQKILDNFIVEHDVLDKLIKFVLRKNGLKLKNEVLVDNK